MRLADHYQDWPSACIAAGRGPTHNAPKPTPHIRTAQSAAE